MKKILLSCVTCLLALGLVTACEDEAKDDGGVEAGDEAGEVETVYKLGALDTTTYEYVYFSGEAATTSASHFLAVTSSWDEAAPVTFEEVTSEEEGVTAVSISFVDAEGATKYISWSDGTAVDIADEPYAWYWVEENSVFVAGSSTGRGLFLYMDNPSFRAYSQTDQYLAYPHVRVYTAEPEAPEAPEVTPAPDLEMVTTLVNGESYYLGSVESDGAHLVTGSLSNYRLSTSVDFAQAVLVTVTSVETDKWTVKIGEDTLYAYIGTSGENTYFDFELSSTGSSNNGASEFSWNSTLNTLTVDLTTNESYGSSSYFEYHNNVVTGYAFSDDGISSITNAAHFYQVATTEG